MQVQPALVEGGPEPFGDDLPVRIRCPHVVPPFHNGKHATVPPQRRSRGSAPLETEPEPR
ncbi:hypothetical protein Vqi01_13850 [Micromonospora qiuiae]|uniref:Uncharacterized protein n=1 Tax=Micromonospora qiuiae TaxID=502268 RepID=A0ABQ4J834_9ACTN|nr:hypothetical protein Vqi01_13850 [Micromonospora qiuiae]